MNRETLFNNIRQKKSYLCIGLDSDPDKIPKHLLKCDDQVYEFNKQIIEATHDLCIAYKPNLAFYESSGVKGLQSLEKSMAEIPENIFTIAELNVVISGIQQPITQKPFLRIIILMR